MDRPGIKSPIVPSWLVSLLAATCALVALGLASIGFYASFGGLVIASAVALATGAVVAGIVDPDRAARNAAVVAFYVLVLATACFLILPALVRPVPAGAGDGPAVDPPPHRGGGPGVYPPQRQRSDLGCHTHLYASRHG